MRRFVSAALALAVGSMLAASPASAVTSCLEPDSRIEERLPSYTLIGIATVEQVSCEPEPEPGNAGADGWQSLAIKTSTVTLRFREVWRGRVDGPVVVSSVFGCPALLSTCDDTTRHVALGKDLIAFVKLDGKGQHLVLEAFRFAKDTGASQLATWKAAILRDPDCKGRFLRGAGLYCFDLPCEYTAVMTDAWTDAWAGYIEPRDKSWRVYWHVGLYQKLLQTENGRRVLWERTELVNDEPWPVGLVEDGTERFLVLGNGMLQLNIAANRDDALERLKLVAGMSRVREQGVDCHSLPAPRETE